MEPINIISPAIIAQINGIEPATGPGPKTAMAVRHAARVKTEWQARTPKQRRGDLAIGFLATASALMLYYAAVRG